MLDKHFDLAVETAQPVSPYDDPECQYLNLPESMHTFVVPELSGLENADVRAVLNHLARFLQGEQISPIDMLSLEAPIQKSLEEIFGEGEVSLLADSNNTRITVLESVFAGIWVAKRYFEGKLTKYYLEAGAYPKVLDQCLQELSGIPQEVTEYPAGLMNAPALLREIFIKSKEYRQGQDEVINLTLLPMIPEDMAYLSETLGLAGLSILAKGYGDCRISRTRLPHVWWVQYFNSTGQLILNTLEICLIPQVVKAAKEDLEDSLQRLQELLN